MVVAVAAGVVIGLLRGGRITNLADVSFRLWQALVIGLAVQAASAFAPVGAVALLLVSYAALILFTAVNFHRVGMGVVLVGIAMNFVVIAANGGMPVRAEAIVAAGVDPDDIATLEFGNKRHLETSEDRLTWLGDIIPVPAAREVLSFGDLVMSVGIADVLVHLLRRRPPATISPDVSESAESTDTG